MKFASVVPLCLGCAFLAALPVLAGPTYLVYSAPSGGAGSTVVSGVNNAGDYVGWCLNSNYYVGFSHDQSGYSAVAPPDSAGGPGTHPEQISESSQIVGYRQKSAGPFRGSIEKSGTFTNLDAVGSVAAYSYGDDDGTGTQAFIMAADGAPTPMEYAVASDMMVRDDASNLGQAVDGNGWYDTCAGCPQIGFLLQSGAYYVDPARSERFHPTRWHQLRPGTGRLIWFNAARRGSPFHAPGFHLPVGVGGPEPPRPPAVPEPATGLLMAAGGMALITLGCLRRPAGLRSSVSGK